MRRKGLAGLMDVGKFESPPPTCVDVEVTLENLYRGTRKQVQFIRLPCRAVFERALGGDCSSRRTSSAQSIAASEPPG